MVTVTDTPFGWAAVVAVLDAVSFNYFYFVAKLYWKVDSINRITRFDLSKQAIRQTRMDSCIVKILLYAFVKNVRLLVSHGH